MPARFTFFEQATQKGYLMKVWAELAPRHWERTVAASVNGEYLAISFRKQGREHLELEHATTGRSVQESNAMWQNRVREEARKIWAKYTASKVTSKDPVVQCETGSDGTGSSTSATSSLGASSTPSPTESAPESGTPPEGDAAKSESGLSGLTAQKSVTTRISTKPSRKTSRRTGSKSPSSSGGSTESSTSDTAPAGSTS